MKKPSKRVYVVSAGDFIKIGITNNLPMRLTAIQTGCPMEVILEWIVTARTENEARRIEKEAHSWFSSNRIRREWFNGSIKGDVIQFLTDHRLTKLASATEELVMKYPKHNNGLIHAISIHNPVWSNRPEVEYLLPLDVTAGMQSRCVLIATAKEQARKAERQWVDSGRMTGEWLLERFPVYEHSSK